MGKGGEHRRGGGEGTFLEKFCKKNFKERKVKKDFIKVRSK